MWKITCQHQHHNDVNFVYNIIHMHTYTHSHTQFGTHFEIYEQHCALEKINLTNLNRAMLNPDFMAYLKVCTPTISTTLARLSIGVQVAVCPYVSCYSKLGK